MKMKKIWAIVFVLFLGCTVRVHETHVVKPSPPPPSYSVPPPWAPPHTHKERFRYRYYPDVEVYFDIDRGLYFYFYMGSWHCAPRLPATIKVKGEFVLLEMGTDKPYIYHEHVKVHYPPRKKGH